MRFDRRNFIRIGAAGVLGTLGGQSRGEAGAWASSLGQSKPGGNAGTLQIDFSGFYLLEGQGPSLLVRLVDGVKLGVGPHVPQLRVPASTIDQKATKKPDPSHVISVGGHEIWLWDLVDGLAVATPSAAKPDLTFTHTAVATGIPKTAAGWKSFDYVPSLRTLFGATKIVKTDVFSATITLNHGHVESVKPDGSGPYTVWTFSDPNGQQLLHQALTNRVRYTCPAHGKSLTVYVGSQPIVFLPGAQTQALVRNLPPKTNHPCPQPCTPNVDHFLAIYNIVDATFKPTAMPDYHAPKKELDAEPNYCPPGRI
jgi:hypothetical protein